MHHASCIMHHASCIMHHASCIMTSRIFLRNISPTCSNKSKFSSLRPYQTSESVRMPFMSKAILNKRSTWSQKIWLQNLGLENVFDPNNWWVQKYVESKQIWIQKNSICGLTKLCLKFGVDLTSKSWDTDP